MGIVDIVEEIQEKQLQKTPVGEERVTGVILGIVTENYHKDHPGRVQVQIPVRDEEAAEMKWVKTAQMYTGKEWGQYFQPEIGDQVLLAFEHGNAGRPFVVGSVPREGDSFLTKSSSEKNAVKRIATRNGNELSFEDEKSGNGEKDRIVLRTAADKQSVRLDNGKKQIALQAEEKLVIRVGDTIRVTMNGANGTIQIDAERVVISAGKSMEYKTDGTAKFSGQQTVIEASSMLKQSSSGMVTIQGSPVKIG